MRLTQQVSLCVLSVSLLAFSTSCTRKGGTGVQVDLLAEAVYEYGIADSDSFTAQPPVIDPRESLEFTLRATFDLSSTVYSSARRRRSLVSLECSFEGMPGVVWQNLVLNGVEITPLLEEVRYSKLPGIGPHHLQNDENTLTVDLRVRNRSREESLAFEPAISLITQAKGDLSFQTGPFLGAYDEDYFTLTCRTNIPSSVHIYRLRGSAQGMREGTGAPVARSEEGLIHRFRITRDPSEENGAYLVRALRNGHDVDVLVRSPVSGEGEFIFAAVGDSRTNTEDWRSVATAVAGCPAELLLFAGDMVANGRVDRQWDGHFWGGGKLLLEKMPIYPVIGNHEENSPLYDELFMTPSDDGRARNWVQEKRGVLLIGIDGLQDWSEGSDNARWLEAALAGSEASFIFLTNHYPPYSSAGHGSVDEAGNPDERTVRECREVVLPLLERYEATALIAGHDHVYERSEPPGGVTVIITGGAGAPRYEKTDDADRQNPYSLVFVPELHYSLFRIDDDTCTMEAITPDGRVIDTRTWSARGVGW